MRKYIEIRELQENNLHISELTLPLGQLIGLVGPSGSGKSTLGKTLFLEGRRLYLESLGLDKTLKRSAVKRPRAQAINGLPPAIYLEQVPEYAATRGSVGSVTDIYTFLRILYSVAGTPFCPECGLSIRPQALSRVVYELSSLPEGTRYAIMIPNPGLSLQELQKAGFIRIEKEGSFFMLDEIDLDDHGLDGVNIVIDRIVARPGRSARIEDGLRLASSKGNGIIKVAIFAPDSTQTISQYLDFTTRMVCPKCMQLFPDLEPGLFTRRNAAGQCPDCAGRGCEKCQNSGLSDFARHVSVAGVAYHHMINKRIDELEKIIEAVAAEFRSDARVRPVIDILKRYIATIADSGLSYLGLCRPITTLSRGELQKLRIAVQIHKGLSGCLVILDEPTVGLHSKDLDALHQLLRQLKASGNSVIVIEHDERLLKNLDWIIELGPGGGTKGGQVCFNGPAHDFFNKKKGRKGVTKLAHGKGSDERYGSRKDGAGKLQISGLNVNNLRNISLDLPFGQFIAVTGPSGSGKSTLVLKGIVPMLRQEGFTVHILDQSPLRGSKSSIVATYLGLFDSIRGLFAKTREARARGFSRALFSLSRPGGRCEECKGMGTISLEINHLPPVEMVCPVCSGARYMPDVLSCTYKGKNILDILRMTIDEAADFFLRIGKIRETLSSASQAGVGYLALGQASATLSGGERMRLRLAKLLAGTKGGREGAGAGHCIVLDEPSAGLHPSDVALILERLRILSDQGVTLLIIEDSEEIIASSDWLIEMGPGGGPYGGCIIKNGPPEMAAHFGNR